MSSTWSDWPSALGFETELVTASDGTRLRVVSAGPLDAPLVILLHGVPQHAYAWRRVISALCRRFRVVAPDLRGIGASEIPSPPSYDLDQLAQDVHTIRGDRQAILVGHDWGAVIAFYLAGRRPEGIRHLVVANGPHLAAYERELRRPAQAIRSWYTGLFQIPGIERVLGPGFFVWTLRASSPAGLFTSEELDLYRAPFEEPGRIASTLAYYRAAARAVGRGFRDEPTIEVPTTLIWGDADRALAPSHPEAVRRFVTHLEVRTLPGVSHWVPEARPAEVVRAVESAGRE